MHGVRHELRAVVEPHVVRRPVGESQSIQHLDDTVGADAAINLDRERFTGELSITFNIFKMRPSAVVSN